MLRRGRAAPYSLGIRDAASVVRPPRGDQVSSASRADKTIRLWDTVLGECRHTLVGHRNEIGDTACTPIERNLHNFWNDQGEARTWDVETGIAAGCSTMANRYERCVPVRHPTLYGCILTTTLSSLVMELSKSGMRLGWGSVSRSSALESIKWPGHRGGYMH
jgi:WD40 repeat protein